MNEHTDIEQDISVDLSKLLGFQMLEVPADCADLGKLMDDTHNKVGEIVIPPGKADRAAD